MPNELRGSDLAAVREQLGREPSVAFTVFARCAPDGHPLVIRNAPIDAAGEPFPTTYWLTCPAAVRAVSRLESSGEIGRLNERLATDPSFADALSASHTACASDRGDDHGGVGGTRTGLKCLHAHYAWWLAGGEDPIGPVVAAAVEPVHPLRPRLAAIDQGTNSIRLLVAEPTEGGFVELARDMVITRLGKGVDETGRLDRDALARTVEVLVRYCRRARALGAEHIRVAATAVLRDASNGDEFAAAVRELSGSDLEVISGEHEAALSYIGAARGLSGVPGPYAVLDIGGGSTELVVGEPGGSLVAVSMRMGSVRLTERHVRGDPPSPDDLARIAADVAERLDEAERTVPVRSAVTLVAVAGTATTMQAIALGLERYDPDVTHGTWLTRERGEQVLAALAAMTNPERAAIPVMAPGRGDVIVAGGIVLVETMRRFGFERALVSETDILDGLVLEHIG